MPKSSKAMRLTRTRLRRRSTTFSRRRRPSRDATSRTRGRRRTNRTVPPFRSLSKPTAPTSSGSSPARTSASSSRSCSTTACSPLRTSTGAISDSGIITGQFHSRARERPRAHPPVGRAAGRARLPRRADGRPVPRPRLDPEGRSRPRSSAPCSCFSSMVVYYRRSGFNAVLALVLNAIILLGVLA